MSHEAVSQHISWWTILKLMVQCIQVFDHEHCVYVVGNVIIILWCIETKQCRIHWCKALFTLLWCKENWFILFASSTESSLVFRTLGARMAWYISENEKWCLQWYFTSCECSRIWNRVTVYFGWSYSQRFLLNGMSQQFIVIKSSSLRVCHAHDAACRTFSLYAGAYSKAQFCFAAY